MPALLDPRLAGVFTAYLPDALEVWRPVTTTGSGSGRTTAWQHTASVAADLQPLARIPLDTEAAARAEAVQEYHVYLPTGTDVLAGDVLLVGTTGVAIGSSLARDAFMALPNRRFEVTDSGVRSHELVRRAVVKELA